MRPQRFDGYKRHVLKDLDLGMVRAVRITRANLTEASVTEALAQDLEFQHPNTAVAEFSDFSLKLK